jgi:hypothetical protein
MTTHETNYRERRIYWPENPEGYVIPDEEFIDGGIASGLEKFFDVHVDIH